MHQSSNVTSWNERGEFIYKGDIIQGTNVVDLVCSATQIHKPCKEKLPQGWDAFTNVMAELNIPVVVIGNSFTRDALGTLKMTEHVPQGYTSPSHHDVRSFITTSPGLM